MGYMRHHAIVVSSSNENLLIEAHRVANLIFGATVSNIVQSKINGYESFFVGPDGSKEGWNESEDGDMARERFIQWINKQPFADGSSALDYAELFYGDDNKEASILNHN